MIGRAALGLLAAATIAAAPPPARAQQGALTLRVNPATGAPRVLVGPVLEDEALAEAARSGLPLRLRFTLELWKDEFFDDLVHQSTWSALLAFEPLERLYLTGDPDADALARHSTYADARAAIERDYLRAVRPVREGRYYYLATLEVETLSLSDLDELERWLRGELEPAVRGSGSVPEAVGGGLKRLLIRVLDLPARRYQARSGRFTVR